MSDDALDLHTAGAGALAAAIAAGRTSALEQCDAAIARIEARDGPINAVVVRDFDRARAAARAADAAIARGERAPLLGVPMTVKESFDVDGLRTTWGSPAFGDYVAARDAEAVRRLKAAGAVILGKTNVPPFLSDWQSDNPIYGRTNNPHDLGRSPGGSSGGGAAALAAGMVPLEFGSDIGGSIRVPAAFCGVFGHKPSYGLVSSWGQSPPGTDGLAPPLAVVGPLARNVDDLELALEITAGPAREEATGYRLALPPARGRTLGEFRVLILDAHPVAAVQSEIRAALHRLADALSDAGARVDNQSDLLPNLAEGHEIYSAILNAVIMRGVPGMPEPMGVHAYMTLQDRQMAIRRGWASLFEAYDIVLAPTFGVVAFPHDDSPFQTRTHVIDGQVTPYGAQMAWAGMAILGHLPSTAFPIGRNSEGLPIGVQAIGPYLEDRTPLAFARLAAAL